MTSPTVLSFPVRPEAITQYVVHNTLQCPDLLLQSVLVGRKFCTFQALSNKMLEGYLCKTLTLKLDILLRIDRSLYRKAPAITCLVSLELCIDPR